MDYNIKLSNGQILKRYNTKSGEDVKAVIILVHGLGEHIQRYFCWADLFKKEKSDLPVLIYRAMAVRREEGVTWRTIPA